MRVWRGTKHIIKILCTICVTVCILYTNFGGDMVESILE